MEFSDLRVRCLDDPPEKIRRRLADMLLGPDLAAKVYGPLEEIEDAG